MVEAPEKPGGKAKIRSVWGPNKGEILDSKISREGAQVIAADPVSMKGWAANYADYADAVDDVATLVGEVKDVVQPGFFHEADMIRTLVNDFAEVYGKNLISLQASFRHISKVLTIVSDDLAATEKANTSANEADAGAGRLEKNPALTHEVESLTAASKDTTDVAVMDPDNSDAEAPADAEKYGDAPTKADIEMGTVKAPTFAGRN